jgi:AcrR family transcriptional regulator
VAGNQDRRARYRAEARTEIKTIALARIARDGVAGLTLTGIAKELGVSGPALYKYFKGRDDLLTELIVDGYAEGAATLHAVLAAMDGSSARSRLQALAAAYREWAVAQPHRYLLLAGTPLPRYEAPAETVALARDVLTPFITVLSGLIPGPPGEVGRAENPPLVAELARWMAAEPSVFAWVARASDPKAAVGPRSFAGPGSAVESPRVVELAAVLASVFRIWIRLHGVVGTEAAGTFRGMGLDPATLLAAEIDALADALGLPVP